MIIERKESDVLTKGKFESKEVTVSSKSIDKMIYLLSNGAYRLPKHSSLREMVSNSVDAQVEVGINCVEKPVILTLTRTLLSVRDFGVGIDDERMEIIQDLGASTKENRNDLIGAMGIGFFAPLSYTNQFVCESVINGTKRSWLVQKVSGKIQIAKLSEEESQEENGTYIALSIKEDYSDWKDAIRETLPYFKGVYVDCAELNHMNTSKIYEGKYFIINEHNSIDSFHIVLDQVVYPLSYREFGLPNDINIGFRFGLDEGIVPLPNRESIIIDDLTKQKVIDRVKEAIQELIQYAETYDNALVYKGANKNSIGFNFGDDYYISNFYYSYINFFNLKDELKKHQVTVDSTYWTDAYLIRLQECFRVYCNFKYNGNINYDVPHWENLPTKFIILNVEWNKKIASFVKEKRVPVVKVVPPKSLWRDLYIKIRLKDYPRSEWRNVINSFFKDLSLIESTFDKISDFKEEINKKREKEKVAKEKRDRGEVKIHTPYGHGTGTYKFVMNSKDYSLNSLPKNGLYIYSDDRGDLDVLHHLKENNKNIYPTYMISKDIAKIEEVKPKNFISLKSFKAGNHRLSKKWITYALIQSEIKQYEWALVKKDYYVKYDTTKLDRTWLRNGQLNKSLTKIINALDKMPTMFNSYQDSLLKSLIETYVKAGLLDYAVYREWEYVKSELDKLQVLKEIDCSTSLEQVFFNHFITYKKGRDFYKKQYLNLTQCK